MIDIDYISHKYGISKKYGLDDVVFFEGEVCDRIGYIKCGQLKISTITSFGNEIVLRKVKAGEFFGNNLIYSATNKYRGTIKGDCECTEIVFFDKTRFEDALSENREFLSYYLSLSSQEANALNKSLRTVSIQNIEERFFYYLSINGNVIKFRSVTDLAETLNMRRETLSRLFSLLERQGKIKRSKNMVSAI